MKFKIKVKLDIDVENAIRELEDNAINTRLNKNISPKVAKESANYIRMGKVEPKLSPVTIEQRKKHFNITKQTPLLMTGRLLKGLKGTEKGVEAPSAIRGRVPYSQHRKGYTWKKDDLPESPQYRKIKNRDVNVPYKPGPDGHKREFLITHLPSESKKMDNIYKEFQNSLVKLLANRLGGKK